MKVKIANTLVLLESAGLKLYGRTITPETGKAWEIALRGRCVNPDFIESACGWFIAYSKDFPAPSEFASKCIELEDDENRRRMIQSAVSKALPPPVSEERRKEIRARLDAIWARSDMSIVPYPSDDEARESFYEQVKKVRA
jgi:hypothetical protein